APPTHSVRQVRHTSRAHATAGALRIDDRQRAQHVEHCVAVQDGTFSVSCLLQPSQHPAQVDPHPYLFAS
ncbi:hypothetical protein, partial [Streptomyces hydrogenans]|uniref:hypothetical protein n=1 Tax=Streptomyces hydrogenans TaxID=1873719 RepID=UPI0035DD955F